MEKAFKKEIKMKRRQAKKTVRKTGERIGKRFSFWAFGQYFSGICEDETGDRVLIRVNKFLAQWFHISQVKRSI